MWLFNVSTSLIFPLFYPYFRVINVCTMLHVYWGMFIFTCLLQQGGRYFQCLNHMLMLILYWWLPVYCGRVIDKTLLIIPLFDPDILVIYLCLFVHVYYCMFIVEILFFFPQCDPDLSLEMNIYCREFLVPCLLVQVFCPFHYLIRMFLSFMYGYGRMFIVSCKMLLVRWSLHSLI